MGYALKKVTCINPSYQCEGCFAAKSCLYHQFYEVSNGLAPYRFNIELGSGKFDFGLYLFNEACDGLPYVLSALEQMLKEQGLTKNRYTFSDIHMGVNGQEVYNENGFGSIDIAAKTFHVDNFCPTIKIQLRTPLRMKKNNLFLRESVDVEDILRSIYQKEQAFSTGQKAFKLDYTPSYISTLKALQYQPLLRKSSRQNKRMNMDGMMGEIAIMGIDQRSYKLLKLGEIIGVGKQTVMGLGRIEVQNL